ncbi:MAG: ABC transporter permease [Nocardioides sp.]
MLADVLSYLTDGDNWSGTNGIATLLVQQLLLTVTAMVLAVVLGLPLALFLGHRHRGGVLAVNVSNVGRAVPVFAVLLVLALGPVGSEQFGPYGRAGLATLIALVLFALPPVITNAYVGVIEVDQGVVEAARGMGMAERQVFRSVELPLAMPVILTGIRLALVQVWATATIAALVAGPGLGRIITRGFANHRTYEVVAGALLVAVGALLLEGLSVLGERYGDPMRRARRQSADTGSGPAPEAGSGAGSGAAPGTVTQSSPTTVGGPG